MSLTTTNQTSITRVLSVNADGKPQPVVSLSGQVNPGKAMTVSMVVSNADLAAENRSDVAEAFEHFVAEVLAMAAENNLPV